MTIEQKIRDLCVLHFATKPVARSLCPQVRSLSAQMWFARRQLMRSQPCTLTAVFTRWNHVTKFAKLHKLIRKQSRLNRKNRLTTFLEESVPFVLRNQMHEWYRRVRTLCPKQQYRRIQMFDPTGAPMSQDQELDRLVEYFQTLFTDVHSPFITHHLCRPYRSLRKMYNLNLKDTKALASDGFLALIWKQFAPQLTPIIYACIRQAWTSDPCIPPTRWSTGWLHLLPKPNKTPNKPEALRPICLQHPVNKIMSGIHCRLMQISHVSCTQDHAFVRVHGIPRNQRLSADNLTSLPCSERDVPSSWQRPGKTRSVGRLADFVRYGKGL